MPKVKRAENVVVEPAVCHTLAHPKSPISYHFRPNREAQEVEVTRCKLSRVESYTLTVDDARQLWSGLLAKGYTRF